MALVAMLGVGFAFAIGGLVIYMAMQDLEEGNVDLMDETITYMGEHRLAVRPGSRDAVATQSGVGTNTTYKFVCRTTTVELAPGKELIVNGFTFGVLKKKDPILVDEGKVFVNERLRTGLPILKANDHIAVPSTFEESLDTRLAGYALRITPRPKIVTRVGGASAQALKADDYSITIRDNELVVDGVHRGSLTPGASITVAPDGVVIEPGGGTSE